MERRRIKIEIGIEIELNERNYPEDGRILSSKEDHKNRLYM